MKKTSYYIHSWPSTIGGAVAASYAVALLVRDAGQTGLTLEHVAMPALVGLTVLFGHEAWRALKEVKLISAVFMTVLAIFGSTIIVAETMGRRAESRDAKVAQAEKTVDQYAVIAADYQRAAGLVAQSEQWTAAECATGKGKKCDGQTFTLNQRKAHAEKLKAELEKATAPAPVDSKADRVAAVLALFGISAELAKKAFQTFDPFTLSLFLELGAVAGFGFGVRTRKVVSSVSTVSETKALSFEREYTDAEIEDLKRVLNGLDKPVTNDQLAALLKCSKSEASKRWRRGAEAGVVEAQRAGRYVHLRLVKAA